MIQKPILTAAIFITLLMFVPVSHGAIAVVATEDISQEPDSGTYWDPNNRDIYYYNAQLKTLTPTGTKTGLPISTSEQAGVCEYVGNWDDPNSYQVVGRCLGLRSNPDGSSLIRIGVRELPIDRMRGELVYHYFDASSVELDALAWRYPCPTTQDTPVVNCQVNLSEPRLVTPLPGDVPNGATSFCPTLSLYLWNGTAYPSEPLLRVEGQ